MSFTNGTKGMMETTGEEQKEQQFIESRVPSEWKYINNDEIIHD